MNEQQTYFLDKSSTVAATHIVILQARKIDRKAPDTKGLGRPAGQQTAAELRLSSGIAMAGTSNVGFPACHQVTRGQTKGIDYVHSHNSVE